MEKETGTQTQLVIAAVQLYLSSLHPYYTYTLTVAAETVALGPSSAAVSVQLPEDGEGSSCTSFLWRTVYFIMNA